MLVAQPIGSHSLAGVQVKVSAREAAEVTCSACAASRRGRLEGTQVSPDGRTITAGHFVKSDGLTDGRVSCR
ncbi:MAG: hypothetical protein ACRDT2_07680 [Natronosporangium sp.]